MKAENIIYIAETKKNIEFNITNEKNDHVRYRMALALNYINGALKAVEIGKDERAWFAFEKAIHWMSEARRMSA